MSHTLTPTHRLPVLTSLVLALATLAGTAQAAAIANGAFAATYVRDCRSDAAKLAGYTTPDKCDDSPTTADPNTFRFTMQQQLADLNPGFLTASMTATNALGVTSAGATSSDVNAAGTPGVITLHQGAYTSTTYARVSGHSDALQSFTYDGTGSANRTVHTVLTYNGPQVVDQPGFQAATTSAAAMVQGHVRVFSLASSSFDFSWTDPETAFSGQGLGFSEQAALTGADYQVEGEWWEFADGTGPLTSNIHFGMTAGRTYFVESYLGLWAKFGAYVDATHSMVSEMGVMVPTSTDPGAPLTFVRNLDGLTPTPTGQIPEPGSVALAGLALAGLLASRRRH